MTDIYLTGDAPYHLGHVFSTPTELIDQLETTLVSAGWVTDNKVAGTSLFIKGTAPTGDTEEIWLEFTVTGTSPDFTLEYEGWTEQAKTNGSGTYTKLNFTFGEFNRMWLACNSGAWCIMMLNSNGFSYGAHFGFVERLKSSDTGAVYIGYITTDAYLTLKVARLLYNDAVWFPVGAGFQNGNTTTVNPCIPAIHFDFMTRFTRMMDGTASPPINSASISIGNVLRTTESPTHGRYNGLNNLPVIDRYGYMEGKNTATYTADFSNSDGYERYESDAVSFRGYIYFAVTGLSGYSAGSQFLGPNNEVVISVGKANGPQGMLIAPPS